MTRIIKHGDIPVQQLTCTYCKCEFEVPANQCYTLEHSFDAGNGIALIEHVSAFVCPECEGIAVCHPHADLDMLSKISDVRYPVTITRDIGGCLAWPYRPDRAKIYMGLAWCGLLERADCARRMTGRGTTPLEAYTDLVSRYAVYEIEEIK